MNNKNRIAWGARKFLSANTCNQIMEALYPPPVGYGPLPVNTSTETETLAPPPARKPVDYTTRLLSHEGIDKKGSIYQLLFRVGGNDEWITTPRAALVELADAAQIETTEIFSRLGDGVRFNRDWLRGWFQRYAPALVAAFDSEVPSHV